MKFRKYYHKPSTFEYPVRCFISTASTAHEELARYWLTEYLRGDARCHNSKLGFRPTRLFFIPNGESSHVRLDISPSNNSDIKYFALGHCWGGASDVLTLRGNNVDKLSESISIAELPKSFQHAIRIVASLGGQ
jgi:hypothetical protein